MALPRAVIDRLLKADVLATPEKIEGAEWGAGVWSVEHDGSDHAPRAGQTKPICVRPAERRKGVAKLLERTDEHDVHGVSRQSVTGNRVTRCTLALENPESHPNSARQNNIRGNSVSNGDGQDPG